MSFPTQFGTVNDARQPIQTTLFELVTAIGDITASDEETIQTTLHMMNTGCIRVLGHGRGNERKMLPPALLH